MRDYNKVKDLYLGQNVLKRVLILQPNGDKQVAYKTKKQIKDAQDRHVAMRVPFDT